MYQTPHGRPVGGGLLDTTPYLEMDLVGTVNLHPSKDFRADLDIKLCKLRVSADVVSTNTPLLAMRLEGRGHALGDVAELEDLVVETEVFITASGLGPGPGPASTPRGFNRPKNSLDVFVMGQDKLTSHKPKDWDHPTSGSPYMRVNASGSLKLDSASFMPPARRRGLTSVV